LFGLVKYNNVVIIGVDEMWKIEFYCDHRGKCPPLEFIDTLPLFEQVQSRNALRLLQEFGPSLTMPHAKHIKSKLWELRAGGVRLFYFAYIEKRFVILHGFRKQSQKTPDQEIEIALRRMKDLLDEV
jgi:phage-related protein